MKHIIPIYMILALLTACSQSQPKTEEVVADDTVVVDTNYDLEEVDTTKVFWTDNFAQLFAQTQRHRYIGFPYFMNEHRDRWNVSNGIYGAYMLAKATGHYDVVDSMIGWRIDHYLASTKADRLKTGNGQDFAQMEQLVNQFRSQDSRDLNLDNEGQDKQLEAIYGIYISYYFQKQLSDMPENKAIAKSLENERLAWKQVVTTQRKLLRALNNGNAPSDAMTGLTKAQNSAKTKADLDFYFSLKKPNYTTNDTLYEKLSDQYAYYDEYNVFIKDIKATQEIGFGKKLQALLNEQKAWMAYIYARRVLSGKLNEKQETLYDNATNRLQKWHIVQLKNRLKGYGYCSDAFSSSLLSDTCTYQQMYKYVPMKLDAQF